jgi:hypothetical protein
VCFLSRVHHIALCGYVVVDFEIVKCILGEVRSSGVSTRYLGLDRTIILERMLNKFWEGADKFERAQGRDTLWAVVNTVMNLLVP